MKTGRKLQVLIDNRWEYVFCRVEGKRLPITTKDSKKAIREKYGDGNRILEYFLEHYGNLKFRLI